jgi:hypothetical protein
MLLMPLIAHGVLGYEEAREDGLDGCEFSHNAYIGQSVIRNLSRENGSPDGTKTSPKVWEEAIRKILAQ